jgi:putative membrane protein
MTRYLTIALAGAATLTMAACGKKAETPAANVETPMPTDVGPPAAPVLTPGQTFANTAGSSDAFEIATSRLAAEKSQSAAIKRFAEQMVKAHTESTAKLKTAAAAATPAIVPDATLTAEQQAKLAALQAKSGADFDTAYAAEQVAAHEAALATLRAYSASGDLPALKSFATGLVPAVTGHLNMAKMLKP